MKYTPMLRLAVSIAVVTTTSAHADVIERTDSLTQRQAYLEKRIQDQDKVLANLSSLANLPISSIELGGVVEVEATHTTQDESDDESDIAIPTVELGIAAEVNDWTKAEIIALYEDEGDGEGQLNIDSAVFQVSNPDKDWYIAGGQYAVPFGAYETGLLSDPLTLALGETSDVALEIGVEQASVSGAAYIFQGNHSSEIESFGFNLAFTPLGESLNVSLGYISDLGESDALVDDEIEFASETPGMTAALLVQVGDFSATAEYLTSTDEIAEYDNAKPSAYNFELGLALSQFAIPANFAIALQGTEEAETVAGGLPESRVAAALAFELKEGLGLTFEAGQEESYDKSENSFVTAQLAIEF